MHRIIELAGPHGRGASTSPYPDLALGLIVIDLTRRLDTVPQIVLTNDLVSVSAHGVEFRCRLPSPPPDLFAGVSATAINCFSDCADSLASYLETNPELMFAHGSVVAV